MGRPRHRLIAPLSCRIFSDLARLGLAAENWVPQPGPSRPFFLLCGRALREVLLGKKKPLPICVLERVHELIVDYGRSERRAVKEACGQFERALGTGKPFSRVRAAYRDEFKSKIGNLSIRQYRISRASQEIRNKEKAELTQLRDNLAKAEERAVSILGTDDLGYENLQEFISTWDSDEIRSRRNIVDRADGEVPTAFRTKYGHLPSDKEIAQFLRDLETLKDRAYLALELVGLRRKIAEIEKKLAD